MKNMNLLKTNIRISMILLLGFALTAVLSYQANYQYSIDTIEQVSSLTADGIYYELTDMFTKPVNISLAMSHDTLLSMPLSEEMEHLNEASYEETIKDYLDHYREKYGFDSVFLVSVATERYYNFNGVDRILTKENPENIWYFEFLESNADYKAKKNGKNGFTVYEKEESSSEMP